MQLKTNPRMRILVAALALVAVLVAMSATVGSLPRVCGGCHAMRPFTQSLGESAHSGVSCYSCHASPNTGGRIGLKVAEITRMYIPGILGAEVRGPTTRIDRDNCLGCHAEVLTRTVERGLRISHASCAATGACDECHSATAHLTATRWITEPTMEACVACHRDRGATVACDACHAERSQEVRLTRGPWAVTHGPNWKQTHGMGDLRTCNACHEPSKCVKCHGVELPHPVGFGGTHSAAAMGAPDSCAQCHDRRAFCDDCHGIEMPHPAEFLPTHMDVAGSLEDPVCLKCHYQEDCDLCHVTHVHPGATDGTVGDTLPKTGD